MSSGRQTVEQGLVVAMFRLPPRDDTCDSDEVCVAASSWSDAVHLVRAAGYKRIDRRPGDMAISEHDVRRATAHVGQVLRRPFSGDQDWTIA